MIETLVLGLVYKIFRSDAAHVKEHKRTYCFVLGLDGGL